MVVVVDSHAGIYVFWALVAILIIGGVIWAGSSLQEFEDASKRKTDEDRIASALFNYRSACVKEIHAWSADETDVNPATFYDEFKGFFDACLTQSRRRLYDVNLATIDAIRYAAPLFDAFASLYPPDARAMITENMKVIVSARMQETALEADTDEALRGGISSPSSW